MTVEEKAKAYDEALERAKMSYHTGDYDKDTLEMLEIIFPELKESEDERIRKEIISFLKEGKPYHCPNSAKRQEWATWLEKQGEHKPIDKVEPKFRIEAGKWYICISQYGNCIESRCYQALCDDRIIDDFGTEYDMHSNAYKYFRLWTIQDAKDGDALDANGAPFIYKKHDKNYVYFYCGVNLAGEFIEANEINTWNNNNKVYPATKEQRDQLEKAIAEAGYKWNKEDLKLEQKPAWSEEDEMFVHGLIRGLSAKRDIHGHTTFSSDCIDITETINWLKSLKDRYLGSV